MPIISNMDATRDYHAKWSKLERKKTNSIWYHLYMDFKIQYKWTYLWNRNRIMDLREQTGGCQGGRVWGRDVGVSRCKSFFIRMVKQQYPTL